MIESQVDNCLANALGKVDEFDALLAALQKTLEGAREASRRAAVTQTDLAQHAGALNELWLRLGTFCEETGLEYQAAEDLPIPGRV